MLADPARDPRRDARSSLADALCRIRDAMMANPEMVAGSRDRLDTSVMKAVPGRSWPRAAPRGLRGFAPAGRRAGEAASGRRDQDRGRRRLRPGRSAASVETLRQVGALDPAALRALAATTGRWRSTRAANRSARPWPSSSWRRWGSCWAEGRRRRSAPRGPRPACGRAPRTLSHDRHPRSNRAEPNRAAPPGHRPNGALQLPVRAPHRRDVHLPARGHGPGPLHGGVRAGHPRGLHWLGIRWDEGPGIGDEPERGAYGPYRQMQRLARYAEAAAQAAGRGQGLLLLLLAGGAGGRAQAPGGGPRAGPLQRPLRPPDRRRARRLRGRGPQAGRALPHPEIRVDRLRRHRSRPRGDRHRTPWAATW
jgi:hypothetical protein